MLAYNHVGAGFPPHMDENYEVGRLMTNTRILLMYHPEKTEDPMDPHLSQDGGHPDLRATLPLLARSGHWPRHREKSAFDRSKLRNNYVTFVPEQRGNHQRDDCTDTMVGMDITSVGLGDLADNVFCQRRPD
jgi:hypothetical protein